MKLRDIQLLLFMVGLLYYGSTQAQTLRVRQAGTNSTRITAQVGQSVTLEVFADLQSQQAAGISFFITVPGSDFFQVQDFGLPGQAGTQPFEQGPLFPSSVTPVNLLLPETDAVAAIIEGQQLDYQAIIGAGANRRITGSGVVATFSILCLRPIENGRIDIDDNPIRETKLFLSDGINEQRFLTVQGLEITVTGLELRDIPDVILTPGQSDSLQIGSLDRYIGNTLSPIDSISWSFEPMNLDSLEVTVHPVTRVVKVVPLFGWTGRQRIVWTATESESVIPGAPPLSANEVSDIVVNNPPSFRIPRGPDGVKRDTVAIVEDEHNYVAGVVNPEPRRAFRGEDLDLLVDDPDVVDPNIELQYIVQPIGISSTEANVLGDDDQSNHDLLVWSRTNFGGVDSLRIIVQDVQRGRDTLRVIVLVQEVPDAPRFILTDLEPRISRGGTKRYRFDEFIEDVDTPLDSLLFSWVDDPEDHFTADTTRVNGDLFVEIRGDSRFTGIGRITFQVGDPIDQINLQDEIVVFITSSEALPPSVFPADEKIDLTPGGQFETRELDLFVEDPDNDDDELGWQVPPVTTTQIGIDQDRVLSASAPQDFVGYEEVDLTVSDPASQTDVLKLRIYSSDGRPVVGGLPDIVIDRGEENREFDLDNFYFDADNQDDDMIWQALATFDANNLRVNIDPLTHLVTYFADENAVFRTESVVFRVTDPSGISAEDTVLVTVRSGGAGTEGAFLISLLPGLQAPVGQAVEVLDLDEFLVTTPAVNRESITWQWLPRQGQVGAVLLGGDRGSVITVFSQEAGLDTLEFAAVDSLRRVEKATTTVRFFGENEVLKLKPIPDIVFVAKQVFTDLNLSDFLIDPVTHPDSLIEWTVQDIGGESDIFVRVESDNSLLVLSQTVGETEIVFSARNPVLGVTGRDTVHVIALDPATAATPLEALPEIVIVSGREDSSVTLNDFIPDDIIPSSTNWIVSGQSITNPFIDPESPHVLRLSSVGNRVGADTLSFIVDLGGGRTARGSMTVTVIEPVDETTLSLEVVPNPLSPNFLDVFVLARRALASSPTVVWSFEATDSTLAVRQIEDNLEQRGVLVWAGGVSVRAGVTGTLFFSAQALTALGTGVTATTSLAVGTVAAGKAVVLQYGSAAVSLPPDAAPAGTVIALRSSATPDDDENRSGASSLQELEQVGEIDLYPAGLQLNSMGRLQVEGHEANIGVYRRERAGGWDFRGPASAGAAIPSLGRYALMRDSVAPAVTFLKTPERWGSESGAEASAFGAEVSAFGAEVSDGGSGIDDFSVAVAIDGREVHDVEIADGVISWRAHAPIGPGRHVATLRVADRAGNTTKREVQFRVRQSLPATLICIDLCQPQPG